VSLEIKRKEEGDREREKGERKKEKRRER